MKLDRNKMQHPLGFSIQDNYPLAIGQDEAEAMRVCLDKIMEQVPEENKPLIEAQYEALSTALWHPVLRTHSDWLSGVIHPA